MSSSTTNAGLPPEAGALPPEIASLLAQLRRRIRAYVWLEGISLAIVWIIAMFWFGLALDYLPVIAGIGEMPRPARAVLLVITSGMLVLILYRWVLRRVFARIADRSLALLLERRFESFRDGLITSVELNAAAGSQSAPWREMLADTQRSALAYLPQVRLSDVFNFRPLIIRLGGAVLLAASLGGFYLWNATALELGASRLYLLKDTAWPRRAHIEVVGVEIGQNAAADSAAVIPFRDRTLKAARGSSLSVVVRADATRPKVPEMCSIHYLTPEGDRGRVNMTSVGQIRGKYQYYKYDGKPFDGILSNVRFDVIGYDHRVSGFNIQVVDSPAITAIQVKCEFPPYMVDESRSQWLPRTVDYAAGMQLPRGTRVSLHCRANKPLKQVQWFNPDASNTSPPNAVSISDGSFEFDHSTVELGDHLTLDATLTDVDDVRSERPYRIHISTIEDMPPVVEMRLRGIGTAVTPDVMMPMEGKITDDYGLSRTWLEVVINDSAPREVAFVPGETGKSTPSLDFRTERSKSDGMKLAAQDKLHLTVKATDKRELGFGPNQASGDHYELAVVTPEQLLTLLESRELALRRRFEQIIEETTETRDMLTRVKVEGPQSATQSIDPEESASAAKKSDRSPEEILAEKLKSVWSLRLLRTRQSLAQSQKSAQELLGVAAAFRDIRDELTNNRVDTQDRKQRLTEQISDPLQHVGEQLFPELDRKLEALSELLGQVEKKGAPAEEDPATVAAAQAAIEQVNQILREMDAVLQKMLDIESFHELLDIVRSLIDEQEKILNETKSEQKKAVLDLLK